MADRPPTPPPVVTGEDLRAKFSDFDLPDVYENVKRHGLDDKANNFVVEFGATTAKIALDLKKDDFEALLKRESSKEDQETPIRWINIWNPSRQRDTIECIGKKYGFSGRLILTIREWDNMKDPARARREMQGRGGETDGGKSTTTTATTTPPNPDIEKTAGVFAQSKVVDPNIQALFEPENVATFRLMQNSIDYTSFDQEKQFVCIGANWLHNRPLPEGPSQEEDAVSPSLVLPNHWSWFVLCRDNTVISFHETASYESEKTIPEGEDAKRWRAGELRSMRSNTLKVLRQLSVRGLEEDKNKIMQFTSVRRPLMQVKHTETAILEANHALEGSSNLYYYLFEDYSGTVAILNTSKKVLDRLGQRVLKTADWKFNEDTSDIIPSLYKLNKELRQLQHLFTSYKTLIQRLLADKYVSGENLTGVNGDMLSKKARDRFERLRDQLQSLMLDTIQDYLDEKDSLMNTYFNLINQKDSQATAHLTRSANLLAKLGVLFLPISFITSYFSVQIPDLTNNYTGQTYWATFGITAGISFVCLFFFSRALMFFSESLDRWADSTTKWVIRRLGRNKKVGEPVDDSIGGGGTIRA